MEVYDVSKNRKRDEHGESEVDMQESKRVRLGSESDLDSAELEVVDEVLQILVDSDPDNSSHHELESVIRSLEEEIYLPPPVNEATEELCESPVDLRYLLGASDDELGIPAKVELAEEDKNDVFDLQSTSSSSITGFEGSSGFSGEISGYDLFDIGIVGDYGGWSSNDDHIINQDFVSLDGLFDYSGSASEPTFWTKSLSAL